ncbi:MAG: MutS-related protein [Acetobacteraceae bacterium]
MVFQSILFPDSEGVRRPEATAPPEFVTDLNLDQIVDAMTAPKAEYKLKPFFYAPLGDLAAVRYRQDVMRDLDGEALLGAILRFAEQMREMRKELERSAKLYYQKQKRWWFLEAALRYCQAAHHLACDLAPLSPASAGLSTFKTFVADHCASAGFARLLAEAEQIRKALAAITYSLIIKDDSITVRDYADEIDYSAAVEETFQKFAQGIGKDYRVKFSEPFEMNHVEAAVLDSVARLNPGEFGRLSEFCADHADFLDPTIARFDREVQFYVAYREYIAPLRAAGLGFCMPELSATDKTISVADGFDLALAHKLTAPDANVVRNDFALEGDERAIIVSGPNQGGKTTFLRMFGQLHYLASLGLPVPGREARLLLFDQLFTHFEREEKVENLRSKFEDDLVRVHRIIERASGRSIVLMNESFSSTSLEDAVLIGKNVVRRMLAKDLICVYVTFVDELSELSRSTVSMVSTIVPGDSASRTFKIVRRRADGRAYAMAIAAKHRLTYDALRQRIGG